MKLIILLALVAVAVARPEETYDNKYDNFDIDEVMESPRLVKAHTACFVDEGKCTSEATEIKKLIPEAISSSCGKCTDKQKVIVAKFLKATKEKYPEEFEKLTKKHDPSGQYQETLNKFIADHAS